MDNQLFRQKSIERISSPEELHDYMRVTSPRLWMLLGAIVLLLVGFIVYASTATMENVMAIKAEVENFGGVEDDGTEWGWSSVSATLPLSMKDTVSAGMEVRIGGEKGKITLLNQQIATGDSGDEGGNLLFIYIEMEKKNFQLPDGLYDADLVLESSTPFSFLWN
jgi:hypothetical protein